MVLKILRKLFLLELFVDNHDEKMTVLGIFMIGFFLVFPAVFYFLYSKTGSLYFRVINSVCILVLEAMSGTYGTRVAHKKGTLRDTLHKRAEATLTRYCLRLKA